MLFEIKMSQVSLKDCIEELLLITWGNKFHVVEEQQQQKIHLLALLYSLEFNGV